MLNTCTETSFSDVPWSNKIIGKSCRIIALAGFWLLFLSCALWADSGKEYIYFNGKAIASDSVSYAKPTCFQYTTTQGFAGIDTAIMHVCNGANMKVAFKWEFVAWGSDGKPSGAITEYADGIKGPMDSSGSFTIDIPQDSWPGICRIKAIKNDADPSEDAWVALSPYPEFTVRPAKPTSFSFAGAGVTSTTINGVASYTISVPTAATEFADNSQNITLLVENSRLLPDLPMPAPVNQISFVMDADGYSSSDFFCQSGNIVDQFTRAKNQWDNLNDAAWQSIPSTVAYSRTTSCGDFTISADPNIQTAYAGESKSVSITFPTNDLFNPPNSADVPASEVWVALNVTGLPPGAAASFSPNPVPLNQSSTLMISTTEVGNYNYTITGSTRDSDGDYSSGYLVHTTNASISFENITYPPRPECFQYTASQGFAGIDTEIVHVCNGADMTIAFKWEFVPWGSLGVPDESLKTDQPDGLIVMNSSGLYSSSILQNSLAGIKRIKAIKNAADLREEAWITLSAPYPEFTIRPAKPTSFSITGDNVTLTTINGVASYAISVPANFTRFIGNSQNQTVVIEYRRIDPALPAPFLDYLTFDMEDTEHAATSSPCQSGNVAYEFTRAKNLYDLLDDAAWQSIPSTVAYSRTPSCGDFTISADPNIQSAYAGESKSVSITFPTNDLYNPPNSADVPASEV
jgi:hypothetical protein